MTYATGAINPEYASMSLLSAISGMSKSTLNRLKAKHDDFPRPIKLSQTFLYKLDEFRAWLDAHQDKPVNQAA